jgi:hypothetical protein
MLLVFIGIFLAASTGLLWADKIDHGNESAIEHFRAGSLGLGREFLQSASDSSLKLFALLTAAAAALVLLVLVVLAVYLVAWVWSLF